MAHANFLSARSAEVILSDIRPTRIRPDTLKAINALLDELLFQVISSARSISPEKLKAALLKVLPTLLGKDAILEAEIELRAYHERTTPSDPLTPLSEATSPKDFPLQPMFELLRMKCEAYSTLSDFDGDADAEANLHSRITAIAGLSAPRPQSIAPAALYLTAILEHVCEHVLSNVARVAARDSSRTAAQVQDLFVALCEDETMYNAFKAMKVHEAIESGSKTSRERRSQSVSRPESGVVSHNSSITTVSTNGFGLERSASSGIPTESSEDAHGNTGARTSVDRIKSINKVFKSTTSHNGDRSLTPPAAQNRHQRTESSLSDKLRRTQPPGDGRDSAVDTADDMGFDNLMRSGTTMKLTLTPDRLQTFEVAKERGQRKAASKLGQVSSPAPSTPTSPSLNRTKSPSTRSLGGRGLNEVDSIDEREESSTRAFDSTRSRTQSMGKPPSPNPNEQVPPVPSIPRARAVSTAEPPVSNMNANGLARKASLSVGIGPSSFKDPKLARKPDSVLNVSKSSQFLSRESPDEASDDEIPLPTMASAGMQPKASRTSSVATTRELLDFLAQGPPEESFSHSVQDTRPKSGKFRSMVSRLARASSERLTPRTSENGVSGQGTRPPPLANKPSASASLNAIKSRPVLTYTPPPAPYHPRTTSPLSASSSDDSSSSTQPHVKNLKQQSNGTSSPSPSTPSRPALTPKAAPNSSTDKDKLQMYASKEMSGTAVTAQREPIPPLAIGTVSSTTPAVAAKVARMSAPASTPTASAPSSLSVPRVQIADLKACLARATSASECRLLVDLFLAQGGLFAIPDADIVSLRSELQQHEFALVDALLGESSDDAHADSSVTALVLGSTPSASAAEGSLLVTAQG